MITLHNIGGIARQSGQDLHGNQYIEFSVDYFAGQEDGTCAQCAREIGQGWMCLDGGNEYCWEHIRFCLHTTSCKQCERLQEDNIMIPDSNRIPNIEVQQTPYKTWIVCEFPHYKRLYETTNKVKAQGVLEYLTAMASHA